MKRLLNAAFLLLALAAGGPLWAAQDGPIATGALQIQGNRLTIYSGALATDADQTVNIGERERLGDHKET